jgi:EAL domain-containing protein (putative c-di-GMP-specific phosphodiesterase class I)
MCSSTGKIEGCEILLSDVEEFDFFSRISMNSILTHQLAMLRRIASLNGYLLRELFGQFIYINVEPFQLGNGELINEIYDLSLTINSDEDNPLLAIEITERCDKTLSNNMILEAIKFLKGSGCLVGLDDFIPNKDMRLETKGILNLVDFIKMDANYISVDIVKLLDTHSIYLVVENVENFSILERVKAMIEKPFYVQGYLFGGCVPFHYKLSHDRMWLYEVKEDEAV